MSPWLLVNALFELCKVRIKQLGLFFQDIANLTVRNTEAHSIFEKDSGLFEAEPKNHISISNELFNVGSKCDKVFSNCNS